MRKKLMEPIDKYVTGGFSEWPEMPGTETQNLGFMRLTCYGQKPSS